MKNTKSLKTDTFVTKKLPLEKKIDDLEQGRNLEPKKGLCYTMERVKGIEPSSVPWEGTIMAIIRHPRALRLGGGNILMFEARMFEINY